MLLGRNPKMSIAPSAKFSQLLDLGVGKISVILDGKSLRVEDAHVTAKTEQDS